jgi:hypothetical protein
MLENIESLIDSSGGSDVFVRIRFAGGRFDSHTIPLDVLPDLAAYRKLLVEVAKILFKKNNGARVRVPKGFEESFQIGLRRIEGGHSAVAEMPRIYPTSNDQQQGKLHFSANDDEYSGTKYREFEDAKQYVDDLIEAVGRTGNVPVDFPVELAGFFNPFGQNLKTDEFAEFGFGTDRVVRYDTLIRKKIVLSRETTYENSVDAIFILNGGVIDSGVVHVLDSDDNAFDFRPPTEFEFNKAYSRARQSVRLIGTGLYDKTERLRRLLEVNVVYEDGGSTQPFDERLKEISETPKGWYDGNNPAPSFAAIEAMRNILHGLPLDKEIPMPYLYPLPDGGISGEWSIEDWEASVEIDPNAQYFELHAVDLVSQNEISSTVHVDEPDLLDRMVSFIKKISSADGKTNAGE